MELEPDDDDDDDMLIHDDDDGVRKREGEGGFDSAQKEEGGCADASSAIFASRVFFKKKNIANDGFPDGHTWRLPSICFHWPDCLKKKGERKKRSNTWGFLAVLLNKKPTKKTNHPQKKKNERPSMDHIQPLPIWFGLVPYRAVQLCVISHPFRANRVLE